jgi:hypothetical protein
MGLRTSLFFGLVLAVLLLSVGAARAFDVASFRQQLEERRVAIERDRKALNADCRSVSSTDWAKTEECRARHDDVVRRIAQYKKDLLLLKSQEAADSERCSDIAAKVTRLEDGIRRGKIVMGKNEKFIREAEERKGAAANDAAETAGKAFGDTAALALEDRLSNFIAAEKNLQKMKKGLDELEKTMHMRQRARMLSEQRIRQAREWVADGIQYGDKVAELGMMTAQYSKAPRSGVKNPDPALRDKLARALKDFNDKFMNDADGWEFVGKWVSESWGGPLGRLAFKTAATGIKLELAGADYLDSDADLAELRANQEKMKFELIKLQQKVKALKASLAAGHCKSQ